MPGGDDVRQLRGRAVTTDPKPADPHICLECNKRFASAASLESHKRVHAMKPSSGEAPQKRRAVAPATVGGPEAKKQRVQVQHYEDTGHESGVSTRSGASYNRLFKCKLCAETFEDKTEWASHMRQRHPQKTPSAQDMPIEEDQSIYLSPRQPSGVATVSVTRKPPSQLPAPPTPERQFSLRSPGSISTSEISPPTSSSSHPRSRNTTLRFEEELTDGQVQCRQCQQVFNNRRGLAAHVAQKHREELDQEQRAIEEEKMRKEEVFQRRRRDASRLIQSGIPQLITPPSRPISILTRRAPGSGVQQRGGVAILRTPDVGGAAAAAPPIIYPRRTTLEILTQPPPAVPSSASTNQASTASPARPNARANIAAMQDSPPTGAYAEALSQQPDTDSSSQEKDDADEPPSEEENDGDDDEMIDESAYEFSTEVTIATVPGQAHEAGARSQGEPTSGVRTRDRSAVATDRDGASSRAVESPGIGEVENYPCRFCKDRVFLTSYGLERHTKMSHPAQLEEVLNDLRKNQLEKAKRSDVHGYGSQDEPLYIDEGQRSYERFPHLDARHQIPGLGTAAQSASYIKKRHVGIDKENEPSDDTGEMLQVAREQTAALVAGASFTDNRFGGRSRRHNDVARAKYQSCDICGILINTEHPKALESHTKAHQKNQELREELLQKYGPSWVERVTCRECNLVFKDEDKLDQHRRNVHVRRRHFLCRFCGDVFRNMRDLNLHKERRHEAFEGHRRLGDSSPPPSRRHVSARRRESNTPDMAGCVEEFACRSTCEVCGLQMVRPSNLIRHMKLAHNRTNFTATVETRGMPPFKIDVHEGQFLWGCCDEVFDDRQAFINHRRVVHGPNYVSNPKECEHCGLTFKNNVTYINHLRSHRPRVCNICGESFGNSVVDLNAFRAHMIRHRDQGYTVRLPPIEEELATKEQQELWKAINDEEADDGSEDEYSVYSESGVESDIEGDSASDDDDAPPDQMTCPICEKTFSCMYRYCDHWKLHCRQPYRNGLSLKTKPFSYKTRRPEGTFKCKFCPRKFRIGETLVLHSMRCVLKKRGILPKEEPSSLHSSRVSSKTSSPLKMSQSKVGVGEAAGESRKLKVGTEENVDGKPKSGGGEGVSEDTMKELEDQLDVPPKKKKFVPDFIEKAYIVEWDTNKPPSEKPYVCQNCHESFGDFLSLIMHVKTHIAHPITEEDENEADANESAKEKDNEQEKSAEDATNAAEKGKIEESREIQKAKNKEDKVTVSILRIRTSTAEELGKYSCQVCGRCFHDQKALASHLDDAHRPKKRHRCNLCRRHFWTLSGLRKHQDRRHDLSGMHHFCGVCGKKFLTMESLNAHESRHELTNSLFQCEDCSVSFYGLQQLKDHFKEHHQGVSILSCPVCARILTDRASLDEHFDNDHSAVRTVCRVCKKVFHTPMEARQHRRRVHMADGKLTESCTLCGKKYFDKRQLALHTWRHLSTKNHQCRICDQPFENDEAVRTHLEQKHDIGWLDSQDMIVRNSTVFGTTDADENEDRCFSCYICHKKFSTKSAVNEHLQQGVHQRVKKRKCTVCGMKFIKSWNLTEHMRRRHPQEFNDEQAAGQEKDEPRNEQGQAFPADVAKMLMDQGQLGNLEYATGDNVQMLVADEAMAAAVMAAAGGQQDYQVLLVQNENGETIQLALGPQAQLELAQLQEPAGSNAGNVMAEVQPMEIDESNYQQFLNN